jgi:hypothetical protein
MTVVTEDEQCSIAQLGFQYDSDRSELSDTANLQLLPFQTDYDLCQPRGVILLDPAQDT